MAEAVRTTSTLQIVTLVTGGMLLEHHYQLLIKKNTNKILFSNETLNTYNTFLLLLNRFFYPFNFAERYV